MPYQFFLIPVRDAGSAASELNAFLRNHRVLAVDRRWVDQGADSYWSFCVDYLELTSGTIVSGRVPKGRGKDYREILSPEDFAVRSIGEHRSAASQLDSEKNRCHAERLSTRFTWTRFQTLPLRVICPC